MIRKTVIISGGFGDIGKAVAEKFAQNHYNVALTYFNFIDNEFILKLKSYGVDALALHCDQRHESEILNFINSVFKEFEFVDACICTAGTREPEGFLTEKTTEIIDEIIDTDLRGTILFNREVLKYFQKQKHGNIVNISSIYGEYGGSLESVYSACKAGINGLTKSLAVEVAPYIRVNAIAPGFIQTKMTDHLSKETKQFAKDQTPLDRLGKPEDVANACYFLASDEASYLTGEILTVSGGAIKY